MEQLAARRAHNPKVVGSNPTPATMHLTCKRLQVFLFLRIWRNWQTRTVQVRVSNHGGSNPFIRTKLCISELFVFRKTLFRICHYSRRCPVIGFFFFYCSAPFSSWPILKYFLRRELQLFHLHLKYTVLYFSFCPTDLVASSISKLNRFVLSRHRIYQI